MTSALEGGGSYPKEDVVMEVALIMYCRHIPNADQKGRGSKNEKMRTSYVHYHLMPLDDSCFRNLKQCNGSLDRQVMAPKVQKSKALCEG